MALRKADVIKLYERQSEGFTKTFLDSILIYTGRGNQYATRDYVRANALLAELLKVAGDDKAKLAQIQAECIHKKDTAKFIGAGVRFRLSMDSPCLAFRFDELKEKEQKELFDSANYVFTEKENGCRGILVFHGGKTHLFSRNYSDVDNSVPEYWGNIYQESDFSETIAIDVEVKFEAGATLAEELNEEYGIITDSKLEAMSALLQMNSEGALNIQQKFKENKGHDLVVFRMIHPLFYKGKNYLKLPLDEGIKDYDEVIEYCKTGGWNVKPIKRCGGSREEKEVFLDTILDAGGEGIVAHNRKGMYSTSENRSKSSWIKLKRSVKSTMGKEGIGDTIDGWVSGFKLGKEGTDNEGLVSALEISIYIRKTNGTCVEHHIASIPNIERSLQRQMTMDSVDGPVLRPEYYGLVIEADGQAISKKSRRLTHPRMLRWRHDKDQHACIYTEEFINSQIV